MTETDGLQTALQSTHHDTQGEGERDPRLCAHQGKEEGTLCKAYKVKGEQYCAGHLGLGGLDPHRAAAASAAVRQSTAEQRKKGLRDRLAEGLEQRASMIEARLADIIENGSDADALRAMEAWLSRVYGRPTERVEVEEQPRTLEGLRAMTPEQRRAMLARLEDRLALEAEHA